MPYVLAICSAIGGGRCAHDVAGKITGSRLKIKGRITSRRPEFVMNVPPRWMNGVADETRRRWASVESYVEECCLAVALHDDVPAVERRVAAGGIAPRDERLAHAGVLDRRQQRVARIGRRLVGEIDAREEMQQEAAGKQRDIDVRCLQR